MNTAQLLKEIGRTDKDLRQAQRVIQTYQAPEPYCYFLPVLSFVIGYRAHATLSVTTILQLMKIQLTWSCNS